MIDLVAALKAVALIVVAVLGVCFSAIVIVRAWARHCDGPRKPEDRL